MSATWRWSGGGGNRRNTVHLLCTTLLFQKGEGRGRGGRHGGGK